MKLYHSTNLKLEMLVPMNGCNRNKGEDPGALNRAVIYLTSDSQEIQKDEKGIPNKYRYTVEVDENDPDLFEDKNFTHLIEMSNENLEKPISTKWYYILHEVEIIMTEVWNGQKYVYM